MQIDSFLVRDNELMESGKIDEQIICDFEKLILKLENYQVNHLDAICKEGSPHHYQDWTNKNQAKIIYAKCIVESVKRNSI